MRHQIAQRDRLAEGRRNLEIEIGVDVGIEIELALAGELHHRRPGEELGDRAGAEQRALRIDQRAGRGIGDAVALLEQDLAVLHHHDHRARDIALRDPDRDEAIREGLDIASGERRAATRRCGVRLRQSRRQGEAERQRHPLQLLHRQPPRSLCRNSLDGDGAARNRWHRCNRVPKIRRLIRKTAAGRPRPQGNGAAPRRTRI